MSFLLYNGEAAPIDGVPVLDEEAFRDEVLVATGSGGRLINLFGVPGSDGKTVRLYAVLSESDSGGFSVAATDVVDAYPALTPECMQAHWFEREIAEQWGVRPEGHPWLKPIRFHHAYRPGADAWGRDAESPIAPGVTDFFRVEGEEVHEVAVGPVHAGIIEPGHFRFQCHGEQVMHLEISLGYQHRGVERALLGGPNARTAQYMETLAGDTSIGHTLAYCQAVEALAGCRASIRAEELRGIALELERLANHTGDIGALAGDVGYLPTAAFCGRLRGDLLNLTALACGSRFGRGWVRPGGVRFDLDAARCATMLERLAAAFKDIKGAIELLWDTPSVMARFEDTGALTEEVCDSLGLVGVAARACGVKRDVRFEYPSGIFRFFNVPVSTWHTGDVFARAHVRWEEINHSVEFVRERLENLSDGPAQTTLGPLAPDSLVVSLVEGWRGEICHTVLSDAAGRIARYKVVDPSFHNWMGLAIALRGQEISDFPLCNKSFNLSYCGHDL
jgi:Ni,Fe-hydrogenase III large subunit